MNCTVMADCEKNVSGVLHKGKNQNEETLPTPPGPRTTSVYSLMAVFVFGALKMQLFVF
jgi:hypothetical protein